MQQLQILQILVRSSQVLYSVKKMRLGEQLLRGLPMTSCICYVKLQSICHMPHLRSEQEVDPIQGAFRGREKALTFNSFCIHLSHLNTEQYIQFQAHLRNKTKIFSFLLKWKHQDFWNHCYLNWIVNSNMFIKWWCRPSYPVLGC